LSLFELELCLPQAIAAHPSLENYRVGDTVIFWHPYSEQGWLRGIVAESMDGVIRVVSGFLGRLIENPAEICSG
jgi:hypothetical protein